MKNVSFSLIYLPKGECVTSLIIGKDNDNNNDNDNDDTMLGIVQIISSKWFYIPNINKRNRACVRNSTTYGHVLEIELHW